MPCSSTQVSSFGFGNNCICDIYLNGSAVAMVDKVKYLGIYFERFERKSDHCDICQASIRFCSQQHNGSDGEELK